MDHRLLLILSAVSLALSLLALAMALAFVNPWREPVCPVVTVEGS